MVALLQATVINFQRKITSYNDVKREIECRLSAFGSYSLGGYIRGADIDLVLICPRTVKSSDFFRFLPELLKVQPTVRDIEVSKYIENVKSSMTYILMYIVYKENSSSNYQMCD